MNNLRIIAYGLFIAFLISGCTSSKSTSTTNTSKRGLNWIEGGTLTNAIVQAREEKKLVFMDFYADWCTPCKMMDKDVYSDSDVKKLFNAEFVNFKINGEKGNGPNLALMYQVQVYPTLLWVDYDGRILARKDGAAYHTEIKRLAKSAIDQKQTL